MNSRSFHIHKIVNIYCIKSSEVKNKHTVKTRKNLLYKTPKMQASLVCVRLEVTEHLRPIWGQAAACGDTWLLSA